MPKGKNRSNTGPGNPLTAKYGVQKQRIQGTRKGLVQDGTTNVNRPGGVGGSSVGKTKVTSPSLRRAAQGTVEKEYGPAVRGKVTLDGKGRHVASVTAGKTTTTTRHETRKKAVDWMDSYVNKHYPKPGKPVSGQTPISKKEFLKPRYNYADNE